MATAQGTSKYCPSIFSRGNPQNNGYAPLLPATASVNSDGYDNLMVIHNPDKDKVDQAELLQTIRVNDLAIATGSSSTLSSKATTKNHCTTIAYTIFSIATALFGLYCLFFKGAACGFQAVSGATTYTNLRFPSNLASIVNWLFTIVNMFVTVIGQSLEVWFLFNGNEEHKKKEHSEWKAALKGDFKRKLLKLGVLAVLMDAWLLSSIGGRLGVMQLSELVTNMQISEELSWQGFIACQFTWLFFVKNALKSIDRGIDLRSNGFQLTPEIRKQAQLDDFLNGLEQAQKHALKYADRIEFKKHYFSATDKQEKYAHPHIRSVNIDQQEIEITLQQVNKIYDNMQFALGATAEELAQINTLIITIQTYIVNTDDSHNQEADGIHHSQVNTAYNEVLRLYKGKIEAQYQAAKKLAKNIAEQTTDDKQLNAALTNFMDNTENPFIIYYSRQRADGDTRCAEQAIIRGAFEEHYKTLAQENYYLTWFNYSDKPTKWQGRTNLILWGIAGFILCCSLASFNGLAVHKTFTNAPTNPNWALPVTGISMLTCLYMMGVHDIFEGIFTSPPKTPGEKPKLHPHLELLAGTFACVVLAGIQTMLMYWLISVTNETAQWVRIGFGGLTSLLAFGCIRPLRLMEYVSETMNAINEKKGFCPWLSSWLCNHGNDTQAKNTSAWLPGERIPLAIMMISNYTNAIGCISVIGAFYSVISFFNKDTSFFADAIAPGAILAIVLALSNLSLSGKQAISNTRKVLDQFQDFIWKSDDWFANHYPRIAYGIRMLFSTVIANLWCLLDKLFFDLIPYLIKLCCVNSLGQQKSQNKELYDIRLREAYIAQESNGNAEKMLKELGPRRASMSWHRPPVDEPILIGSM